ncbi:MAG TPA: Gfo/Idh/MocA family oxidoreductase [Kiritimatiellia bacterium]|nr:Gfo/Idh/MocA family oxidoreductase [Kiritimatiellia bacterium]
MKVGIIGAGLQCRRRAPVLVDSKEDTLVAIASLHKDHAERIASQFNCRAVENWREVVDDKNIDALIVCTPPHVHAEITIAALEAGKHVLCEKPLTRTIEESEAMISAARKSGKILKCGFNHRHHPAIWEAKTRLDRGELGRPLFARCRYGICGRPGYEKEWRADPSMASGGQFIEQGTHGIDLFRWFLGELVEVSAMTSIHYFKEQELDDGGMALFRGANGATAMLHTTLVQWKNLFSFEVFGEDGYVQIEGLGGGYGTETLSVGRRDFTAPFQDHVIHYRGGDRSWHDEWREFTSAIKERREPIGNGLDGLAAMKLGLAAYESEKTGRVISIPGAGA